jgi:hypothetical protein
MGMLRAQFRCCSDLEAGPRPPGLKEKNASHHRGKENGRANPKDDRTFLLFSGQE